jgi:hypothetical protein
MESKFHRAMARIYEEAKKEGYTASYFLKMLGEHGGVETARRLVNADKPSEGFTRLWMMKRLDLSVESLVLKPEWRSLFSDEERYRARDRLAKYGFIVIDDDTTEGTTS